MKKSNSFNDFDECTIQQALCTRVAYVLYVLLLNLGPDLEPDLVFLIVTEHVDCIVHSYIRIG